MAAKPIPRENNPRYRASADQFTVFKSRFVDAFANGVSDSFLTQIQQALGVQLDESTKELKAKYPIALPRVGFEKFISPMEYRKWSETEVESTTAQWRDGVVEELAKHLAPGPSMLKSANEPALWAQSALDTAEKVLCEKLQGATSGNHGFDGVPFFCALDAETKLINPKGGTRKYGNHKTIALDAANPIAFWESVEEHFRNIPALGERGYLKLEPVATLSSSKTQKILRNVAEKKELRVKVGTTEAIVEENRWQGKFAPLWTNDLEDDELYVFAKGAQAGVPFIIHVLEGMEELFGGEFMSPKDWRAMTGTYLQPLMTWWGPESEWARDNEKIRVKAGIDFDITLMCPWSVLKVKVTYP